VKILQKVLGGGYFFDSHCI